CCRVAAPCLPVGACSPANGCWASWSTRSRCRSRSRAPPSGSSLPPSRPWCGGSGVYERRALVAMADDEHGRARSSDRRSYTAAVRRGERSFPEGALLRAGHLQHVSEVVLVE